MDPFLILYGSFILLLAAIVYAVIASVVQRSAMPLAVLAVFILSMCVGMLFVDFALSLLMHAGGWFYLLPVVGFGLLACGFVMSNQCEPMPALMASAVGGQFIFYLPATVMLMTTCCG